MVRIANPSYFRAEAVGIDWSAVAKAHGQRLPAIDGQVAKPGDRTLRLSWACGSGLGVPHGVFTVWRRPITPTDAHPVPVTPTPTGDDSLWVNWRIPAGRVVIDCGVRDPLKPVVVKLCWRTTTRESVTAIGSVGPGIASAHVDLRTAGATCAIVMNAVNPVVRIVSLDEIVNAADWEPVEYVGLPVPPAGIAGTDYDGYDQGLVSAIVPAPDAAVERLARGAPPIGWFPTLPSGVDAPLWKAPDPKQLVEHLRTQLLGRIADLYTPGLPENEQAALTNPFSVGGPLNSGQPASIDAGPWILLSVPALSDPFLNLALGFGTAYPFRTGTSATTTVPEFLVTATYASGAVFREGGLGWSIDQQFPAGEYAAYAPAVGHAQTPAPLPFNSAHYSLQPPTTLDAPWRENVRSTWPPLPDAAGTVHVTQFAPVRSTLGTDNAEPLFTFDADYDGWRVPNVPPLATGETMLATIDPATEIPLGSGGRKARYSAALSDVYGVWSAWNENAYLGTEPAATPPMLANLKLATRYAGTPQCPATLDVEVLTEWRERSTSSIDLSAVLYRMDSPSEQPPTGIGPETVPAGALPRTFAISFAGDMPTGVGCTVAPLNSNGLPSPGAGPSQGEPRRFTVHVDLPPLDFAVADRWGVALWARRTVTVGPSPTSWAPEDPSRAMLASVGSPVPVIPATVPLPGVPLASLPDADGHSHAKVVWGAPGSNNVKSFVIWQASEEYLRERCGAPDPLPRTVPGARLVALRQLLVDHQESCRLAFRRVLEASADRREADVTLARGATSIQVFLVTSTTKTGADSPWPYNTSAQDFTQAFIAPRVVGPGQPLARTAITTAGVQVDLEVASEVPVSRFRVYSTHNFDAARRADSMGAPEFAMATGPADPPGAGDVDLVSGLPLYRAGWSGALAPSWKTWYLRTVADPDTSSIPERGWRGVLSPESDIVTVRVPPSAPPDLDPLVVESVTADHNVFVARTSTSAPIPDTDLGPHLVGSLSGDTITADGLSSAALSALSAVLATDPPPPPPGSAVVTRGERTGGRTPLAIWFTRADATDSVDVGVRLVDPLGRASVQLAQVPGWTAPNPPNLTLVAVTRASANATVITVSSTEERTMQPPFVLAVAAARRIVVRPPLGLKASIELPAIRSAGRPPVPPRVQFAYRDGSRGATLYDIYVPLTSPFSATVTLTSPGGPHTSVRANT